MSLTIFSFLSQIKFQLLFVQIFEYMTSPADEQSVSRYLIENNYYLTALEFFCENYERTGIAIEDLSQFFEDSANFLMFEDMKSVSEISSTISEPSGLSNDAIRIKDDRIAVLEHDIRFLRDSLEEAQSKLQQQQHQTESVASVKSQSHQKTPSFDNNKNASKDADEDFIISKLISRYLQSRNLKLSALAFNNETGIAKQDKIQIPSDVDLYQLLRTYRFVEDSPEMTAEIESLRKEKENNKIIIAQLKQDLQFCRQQNQELTNTLKSQANEKNESNKDSNQEKTEKNVVVVNSNSEPPTVTLLNTIFNDMMQLMNVIDPGERRRILQPLETIVRYHPLKETRIQCISLIFNLWDDPNEEQRQSIIRSIEDCSNEDNRIESEVLPVVSQLLGSTNFKILCLVAESVADFAPYCAEQLRSSLLLSIIRQLSEHSNPTVRTSAAKSGSKLVETFLNDSDANDKLPDLLSLCKQFVFDPDAMVQQAALQNFAPTIEKFTKVRQCVGREFCEFWLKLAFNNGLTGSSSLAALRFKLCCKVLENSLKSIIPVSPQPDQQLVALFAETGNNPSPELITIPKSEYDWLLSSLVPQLPKLAPTLYSTINIRKEADKFVAHVCKTTGQQFVAESIVPAFLTAIDKADGDLKEKTVTLFLSAVAPMCDQETFFTHSRNFLTYATNDLRGFKSRDIQDYFAPAFALLTARDQKKRALVFKQIDELSKSSRVAIKTAANTVLCEILPTLEEVEIEKNVIPIITRLAGNPDETLLLEVINCVGSIARFCTSNTVISNVKEFFDVWCRGNINIRMQALRVFAVVAADVDEQFRDGFILPKLLEIAKDSITWAEPGSRDQAIMLVLHIIHAINNPTDRAVQNFILPLIEIVKGCDMCMQDPKLLELLQRYNVGENSKSENSTFAKMFGQK
ncbi:hypothetical protein TRFO_06944 [Tritrichomonas foetus]|uniref:Uncharacterized protein n=1 Tax=Tritrichomonas foetus TaxID=1144522 RepID=A0A1J4JVZ9_9EUKA|nr:hypothetical protein TRFO_06944 [Tritrichomonas foetus]|eukprot:OHT02890.1 hypothetical protein TRFO_06944 [Tritrichomonas foetus]